MVGYPSKSDLMASPPVPMLKEVNEVPLTRKLLTRVLSDLSERLYRSFRRQVRLVVHGGAVMVLHPSFSHRESTQDVDYVHRSFVSEYRALGFPDTEQPLRTCIAETARQSGLGADWMNDHADVALPWALEYVMTLNPPLPGSFCLTSADDVLPSSIPMSPNLQPKGAHVRPDLPRLDV
jgi:hypothetical protein